MFWGRDLIVSTVKKGSFVTFLKFSLLSSLIWFHVSSLNQVLLIFVGFSHIVLKTKTLSFAWLFLDFLLPWFRCDAKTTDWIFGWMILHVVDWQVLYWLSGLTCTDENFIIKSGAQRAASTHGIALVAPDTSPSEPTLFSFFWFIIFPWCVFLTLCDGFDIVGGLNVEGEADSYDFGVGMQRYMLLVCISHTSFCSFGPIGLVFKYSVNDQGW